MQTRKAVGPDPNALEIDAVPSDRFAYQGRFVPFILKDAKGDPVISVIQQTLREMDRDSLGRAHPESFRRRPRRDGGGVTLTSTSSAGSSGPVGGGGPARPGDDIESGAWASDFGVILLERTRLTPSGFALGEQVMSLSLGPGEEVTIEQKTFSERAVTYEEVSDSDQEVTSELGSSYTTEVSEALSRVSTDTNSRGFNVGGTVGISDTVNLSLSAGYTDSVTNALSSTSGETVRNVMTKTEKLTGRRRAQHKVTMKVSETTRFETGNKRVIRNPNQFTPIDLVYFKVMQKVKIAHERYGVRFCWAPFIPDPGIVLDQAESSERARLERETPLTLPTLRPMPVPSTGSGVNEVVSSNTQELTAWGQVWGDMRADYWFSVMPSAINYTWDGKTPSLNVTTTGFGARGEPSVYVVLAEADFDSDSGKSGAKILIHAGVDWGGTGAHLYVEFKMTFIPNTATGDAAYQADLAKWREEKDAYDKEVATRTADRETTLNAALAEWRKTFMKTFDPVSSAYQMLVAKMFPLSARDEGFEVEMWNKVFDFGTAAFQYYPGWWSNRERRNPDKPADAFENASWMRVFLPIRPGFEEQALNLILDRRVFTQTQDPRKAEAIKNVIAQLTDARNTYFGGMDEIHLDPGAPCPTASRPYVCLAHWDDYLPTDGTHLEVVQAKTTAIDDTSDQAVLDAHQMMSARIGSQESEGGLTTAVKDKVTGAAELPGVDVRIGIGATREA